MNMKTQFPSDPVPGNMDVLSFESIVVSPRCLIIVSGTFVPYDLEKPTFDKTFAMPPLPEEECRVMLSMWAASQKLSLSLIVLQTLQPIDLIGNPDDFDDEDKQDHKQNKTPHFTTLDEVRSHLRKPLSTKLTLPDGTEILPGSILLDPDVLDGPFPMAELNAQGFGLTGLAQGVLLQEKARSDGRHVLVRCATFVKQHPTESESAGSVLRVTSIMDLLDDAPPHSALITGTLPSWYTPEIGFINEFDPRRSEVATFTFMVPRATNH